MWLVTRNKPVVHPEESFRRTLIAHIRGVYGRKAFNAQVEASLLNLLRQDKKRFSNPWERCFPGNLKHIGKRGFNKKGYHEEKAFVASKEEPQVKKQRTGLEHFPESQSLKNELLSSSEIGTVGSQSSQTTKPSYITSFPSNETVKVIYQVGMIGDPHTCGWFKQLALSLMNKYSFDDLSNLIYYLERVNVDILSPSIQYYLKYTDPFDCLNLPLMYIFPPLDQVAFVDHRSIGKVLLNLKTWMITEEDDNSKGVLRRSIKGANITQVVESPVDWLILFPKLLFLLETSDFGWVRLKLLKGDGRIGIFTMRVKLRGDDFAIFLFQDHSDFFPQFLQVGRLA